MTIYDSSISAEFTDTQWSEYQWVDNTELDIDFEGLSTWTKWNCTRDSKTSNEVREAIESIF